MSIHADLGAALIVVSLVGALLVLVARGRPGALPTVRVFVQLCAGTAAVEALIGIVLLLAGNRPAEGIHFFYGAATVVPIPLAQVMARRVGARDELFYLLIGTVATALFGFRALTTGNT
jgi:hypothetical protein